MSGLEARRLTRSHPGHDGDHHVAVRGVDLSLAPGENVALIGRSGCGKTTLLRALLLLDSPGAGDRGEVLLDGGWGSVLGATGLVLIGVGHMATTRLVHAAARPEEGLDEALCLDLAAAALGSPDLIRLLLDRGALAALSNRSGLRARDYALRAGREENAALLP